MSSVIVRIGDFRLENKFHAQPGGALLQDFEQLDARDPAKPVAAGGYLVAFEEDIYIVPVAERTRNLGVGLLIDGPEPVHGLIGKDDAPAERVIGPIALNDRQVPRRLRFLEQDRKIKPRRTAAQANDSHRALPPGSAPPERRRRRR